MHPLHHRPDGDGPDALMTTVRARVRRAATAQLWAQRFAAILAVLRDQLADVLRDNDVLREEVMMLRHLAALHVYGADIPPPPDAYIWAVRTGERRAAVVIDGMRCVVALAARPLGVDPRRELDDWAQLVRAVRSARDEIRGLAGSHA